MSGKGDTPRPVDREAYDRNYARVFGTPGLREVLDAVREERRRQDDKWGEQDHPDVCPAMVEAGAEPRDHAHYAGIPAASRAQERTGEAFGSGLGCWSLILTEELAEAIEAAALDDVPHLREELIQVAAVAVAWVEAIDRRPTDAATESSAD